MLCQALLQFLATWQPPSQLRQKLDHKVIQRCGQNQKVNCPLHPRRECLYPQKGNPIQSTGGLFGLQVARGFLPLKLLENMVLEVCSDQKLSDLCHQRGLDIYLNSVTFFTK
ncbi:hypothetical protein KP509_10G000600 [Ceratopteris richardii]|uniref:Uncharacterized protein n=1 Tax=Ceratopteris richardii TaxID=49495 RepID=A0A8T2TS42_CERRI|nr:hypothetical protein KP509_10G000600 [Ceratopteris richardii]